MSIPEGCGVALVVLSPPGTDRPEEIIFQVCFFYCHHQKSGALCK